MDKKIKAISKLVGEEKKGLKSLAKEDKKRDKVCEVGKKEMMKKKGKK